MDILNQFHPTINLRGRVDIVILRYMDGSRNLQLAIARAERPEAMVIGDDQSRHHQQPEAVSDVLKRFASTKFSISISASYSSSTISYSRFNAVKNLDLYPRKRHINASDEVSDAKDCREEGLDTITDDIGVVLLQD